MLLKRECTFGTQALEQTVYGDGATVGQVGAGVENLLAEPSLALEGAPLVNCPAGWKAKWHPTI